MKITQKEPSLLCKIYIGDTAPMYTPNLSYDK